MKKLKYVTSVKGFYKRFVKIIKHFKNSLALRLPNLPMKTGMQPMKNVNSLVDP